MSRLLGGALLGFVFAISFLAAQEEVQRGTIKKVDTEKGILTIAVDGKNQELTVTADSKIVSAANKELEKGLRADEIKEGVAVLFKTATKDGKSVLVGMKIAPGTAEAGGDIRRGKIKKIDLEGKILTLTVGEKDQDFLLDERTRVLDAEGDTLKERFAGLKVGSTVFFKTARRDGKEIIVGVKPTDGDTPERPEKRPKADTSALKPLPELGMGEYQGYKGGLYPDGKNERPTAHEAAGVARAREVQPLDADGKPSAEGKIVLLSIGMSNTSQASEGFRRLLAEETDLNPHVVFVNGAQGGMTAARIQSLDSPSGKTYWDTVDQRLKSAGVTRAQVQAIWIKQADAGPTQGFPRYAKTLQEELANVVQLLPGRFPNIKLVYLSSRTYGGYARSGLNPEPYAYESGFSVKWLVEQQIKGEGLNYDARKGAVKAPWLSWGPYLWANGTKKRTDGFSYEEKDFAADGTHQSSSGQAKVGKLLLDFFKTDTTTRPWFVQKR